MLSGALGRAVGVMVQSCLVAATWKDGAFIAFVLPSLSSVMAAGHSRLGSGHPWRGGRPSHACRSVNPCTASIQRAGRAGSAPHITSCQPRVPVPCSHPPSCVRGSLLSCLSSGAWDVGGRRTLRIPATLAYGARGAGCRGGEWGLNLSSLGLKDYPAKP